MDVALQVYSDTSKSLGFKLYFKGHWCAEEWLEVWKLEGLNHDLSFLEFFPILVAIHLWTEDMRNATVHFWCNNKAVVYVINSLTTKSHRVMSLVYAFTKHCLWLNTLFLARHVPELAPEAGLHPVELTEEVWSFGG